MSSGASLGIDFGTTNTVVAMAGGDGPTRLVRFPAPEGELFAFRTALSFHAPPERPAERTIAAGPWAIEAYVEDPAETRFIQSFKSFAAQASFSETQVLGRRYRFEDLLSTFLLKLRDYAGQAMIDLPARVIVGRPVTFAGAAPDPRLALARYETAFRRLGFEEVLYAYEPVGAAFFFARELTEDATVLVSPHLGRGSSYESFGKVLPIPNRYYSAFARWDQLALMRASKDMREIRKLVRDAVEPEKIGRLVETLDANHGYVLYRAVSRLKETLSRDETAEFRFEAGDIAIVSEVSRAQFEGWIAPELSLIEDAVDAALADARLGPEAVDRVFLTGGSSLVPAVRRIFHRRFAAERIESGAELESIASGLALIGLERELSVWTSTATEVAR